MRDVHITPRLAVHTALPPSCAATPSARSRRDSGFIAEGNTLPYASGDTGRNRGRYDDDAGAPPSQGLFHATFRLVDGSGFRLHAFAEVIAAD